MPSNLVSRQQPFLSLSFVGRGISTQQFAVPKRIPWPFSFKNLSALSFEEFASPSPLQNFLLAHRQLALLAREGGLKNTWSGRQQFFFLEDLEPALCEKRVPCS